MKKIYLALIVTLFLGNCQKRQFDSFGQDVVGKLYLIASAQFFFKANCVIDKNSNNIGEYAFLQELLGSQTTRFTDKKELLSIGFTKYNIYIQIVTLRNYNFCIYLPGKTVAVRKLENLPREPIETQEKYWICYAWPNTTKGRVFVINQSNAIFCFDNLNKRYYGHLHIPEAYAALSKRGNSKTLNALLGTVTLESKKSPNLEKKSPF